MARAPRPTPRGRRATLAPRGATDDTPARWGYRGAAGRAPHGLPRRHVAPTRPRRSRGSAASPCWRAPPGDRRSGPRVIRPRSVPAPGTRPAAPPRTVRGPATDGAAPPRSTRRARAVGAAPFRAVCPECAPGTRDGRTSPVGDRTGAPARLAPRPAHRPGPRAEWPAPGGLGAAAPGLRRGPPDGRPRSGRVADLVRHVAIGLPVARPPRPSRTRPLRLRLSRPRRATVRCARGAHDRSCSGRRLAVPSS